MPDGVHLQIQPHKLMNSKFVYLSTNKGKEKAKFPDAKIRCEVDFYMQNKKVLLYIRHNTNINRKNNTIWHN